MPSTLRGVEACVSACIASVGLNENGMNWVYGTNFLRAQPTATA